MPSFVLGWTLGLVLTLQLKTGRFFRFVDQKSSLPEKKGYMLGERETICIRLMIEILSQFQNIFKSHLRDGVKKSKWKFKMADNSLLYCPTCVFLHFYV